MKSSNKVVVYTAIMGGIDKIIDPKVITPNVDYICFTDNSSIKSNIWKIVYIEDNASDKRKKAREIKLKPHLYVSDYEFSIWIDGNVAVLKDLNELIGKVFFEEKQKIATFKHFSRNCIYEEAVVCSLLKKDDYNSIYKQVKYCIDNNYPTQNGLAETNVVFRKHNDSKVIECMDLWWDSVCNRSVRDQLSFNISVYMTNIDIYYLKGNARFEVSYFKCHEHKAQNLNDYYFKVRNLLRRSKK